MITIIITFFEFVSRPVPTITLRKRGLHMTLGNISGNINRLVIKSFNQDDAGRYKCRAKDRSGHFDTKSTVVTMEGESCIWTIGTIKERMLGSWIRN